MDTAERTMMTSAVSIGSVGLAFLASQHHTLMMLMLGAGTGAAGMSFMTALPTVRRSMLALSLVMACVTLYRATSGRRPMAVRAMAAASVVLTVGLVAWSVSQFGL